MRQPAGSEDAHKKVELFVLGQASTDKVRQLVGNVALLRHDMASGAGE
jgi:hypothetical protein